MKQEYIIGGIVVIALIALGVYVTRDTRSISTLTEGTQATSTVATSTDGTSTTTTKEKKLITIGGVTFETDADNPSGVSIERVPVSELPKPIPVLTGALVIDAKLPADAQKIIREQLTKLIAELQKDPSNEGNWVRLGVYRKIAADYQGAKIAWEYAKKLSPNDTVVYNNLADLYQFYLKDTAAAELNWKKTISLDPKFIPGYRSLYELYMATSRASMAKAILEQGIKANPRSIDLYVLLGSYYRTQGQNTLARSQFEKALAEAKRVQDKGLITAIQAEIDRL